MSPRLRQFWKSAKSNMWGYTALLGLLLILWPVATVTGWITSVAFVAHISMAAFVVAVIACIETTRIEVKEENKEEV